MPGISPMRSALARRATTWCCPPSAAPCTAPTSPPRWTRCSSRSRSICWPCCAWKRSTSKKEQTKQKGEARGLRLFFMYRSERFQLFVDGHHGADLVLTDEGGRPAARLRAGLEDGLVAPAQGAAVRDAE